MEVEGYERCVRCERLVPEAIWLRSNRLCEPCIEAGCIPKPPPLIKVGATVVPLRVASRRGRRYKGAKATRQATKRAHSIALRRLRDCFPDLYRLFYVAARAELGLPPVPLIGTRPLDTEALERAAEAAGPRLDLSGIYADAVSEEVS